MTAWIPLCKTVRPPIVFPVTQIIYARHRTAPAQTRPVSGM